MSGCPRELVRGFAPADEVLSLNEQGKYPKELAPRIPRLLQTE